MNLCPLTGQAKVVQSLLWGGVEVRWGEQPPVWHQEIVGVVGAPETHETHGAVVEGLRNLHHGRQLIVTYNPPRHHVETTGVHRCTATHWRTAHSKVLLTHVHHTWRDSYDILYLSYSEFIRYFCPLKHLGCKLCRLGLTIGLHFQMNYYVTLGTGLHTTFF